MSKHHSTQKINNAHINTVLADPVAVQIAEAVSHEELSSPEISELLHEDTQTISRELNALQKVHVVQKHRDGRHQVTYRLARPQLESTIHILYGLWADTLVSRHNYSTVQI